MELLQPLKGMPLRTGLQPLCSQNPEAKAPTAAVEVLPDPVARWKPWVPATIAQAAALRNQADILLLGGAAGSLKTSTILMDLIMERDVASMRSYFFRRTYSEMTGGDSAIDQSQRVFRRALAEYFQLFREMLAVYNDSKHTWRFPSGAELYFRHAQHEKDIYQYQGHAMSALGIDESTHWPEKMVRYLISRNRSVDPDLKIRVRLGTNPGNIGHDWHKKLFFNGVCPHCMPDKAPGQGVLRYDARWPSDGREMVDEETGTRLSVSYILSFLREHDLLKGYAARLKMQNPIVAEALLNGCWQRFEGQYFTIFDTLVGGRHVKPRTEIKDQWWWPRWVSSDYGFTISVPAAQLWTHEPPSPGHKYGRTICLDETDGRQLTAREFAKYTLNRWALGEDGRLLEYRWMPWYLDPSTDAERGKPGGSSFNLYKQMNEELSSYGLSFTHASNDRVGGALKIYTGFENDELIVCANCTKTIEAIASRVHDPDHENDVKKILGEERGLDDFFESFRYGYYSYETAVDRVPKPPEVKLAEAVQGMDPTSAWLQSQRLMREAYEEEEGGFYDRNARRRINKQIADRARFGPKR